MPARAVIIPDAIGHGKSSRPSDGLRAHFPQYSYQDMVAAQYALVTKGLEVNKSNWANTLDTAPFEAYAVTCGITFSFGGLKINTSGQVMSSDGQPISGLYAAGELVGGIFWFNYPGGSGLTNGSVFGRIAGTNAAYHQHE